MLYRLSYLQKPCDFIYHYKCDHFYAERLLSSLLSSLFHRTVPDYLIFLAIYLAYPVLQQGHSLLPIPRRRHLKVRFDTSPYAEALQPYNMLVYTTFSIKTRLSYPRILPLLACFQLDPIAYAKSGALYKAIHKSPVLPSTKIDSRHVCTN